jgi:Tfp pilus assembly ATPase PilU
MTIEDPIEFLHNAINCREAAAGLVGATGRTVS